MVLVSGVLDGAGMNDGAMDGIALALGSAVLYALITAVNRKYLGPVDAYDKTTSSSARPGWCSCRICC